jgi:hypothetical protein
VNVTALLPRDGRILTPEPLRVGGFDCIDGELMNVARLFRCTALTLAVNGSAKISFTISPTRAGRIVNVTTVLAGDGGRPENNAKTVTTNVDPRRAPTGAIRTEDCTGERRCREGLRPRRDTERRVYLP